MAEPVPDPAAGPTHPCARCGRPVGPGVGLCEECNPLGLRDVAASQAHGTVFVGLIAAFVGLALLARLAVSGQGPFPARVDSVVGDGPGLAVTLTVTNEGAASGQTTCRLTDITDRTASDPAFVLSPRVEPGDTVSFTRTVTELGPVVRPLAVECRTP
jgi:hypothetical protein